MLINSVIDNTINFQFLSTKKIEKKSLSITELINIINHNEATEKIEKLTNWIVL